MRFISGWLSLFGIVAGAFSVLSALTRLLDVGLIGFLADIVGTYRAIVHPVIGVIGSMVGLELTPLQADLVAIYFVIQLVVLRLVLVLQGFFGYLHLINPVSIFSMDAMVARMALVNSIGLSFSFGSGAYANSKLKYWISVLLDYFSTLMGPTLLWPICFRHLWINRYCYSLMGRVIAAPDCHEPDFVAFDFRAAFLFQLAGLVMAAIIFFILDLM